ncbi:MAG: WD40/YVTN/BNR-like repeat-containing protein [Rhizomicrobium sp.]
MARGAIPKTKPSTIRTSGKSQTLLLVATRKGAWLFQGDAARRKWRTDGPHFLGHIINHLVLDPRGGGTMLAAASTGHLGPTIFRSTDLGRHWKEAKRPPAFANQPNGAGRSVKTTFWLTAGHVSEPGVWYAGTSPQGLFRSEDHGDTWEPLHSVNDNPDFQAIWRDDQGGTPDGPTIHSINIDPRDARHLYFGMSSGGVHESTDGGRSWTPLLAGMEVVDGLDVANIAFHDPHCVRLCPSNPDRLYQQNHCGIYRLDRPGKCWERIGRNMPKKIGDIGFPIVVHPYDDKTAWVFPMDGTSVWPRTSPEGRPAVYMTTNAGRTWRRQSEGLPEAQGWWTVKRQAMTSDDSDPVGLYFGTTGGELWMSRDEGEHWQNLARHLPEIYAVEVARMA